MKKIASFILAVILAFSALTLVSCGGDDSSNGDVLDKLAGKAPDELYEITKTALKSASKYSISSTQVTIVDPDNDAWAFETNVIGAYDGEKVYAKMTNDQDPDDTMEIWYVDGMAYVSREDGKTKSEISKTEFTSLYTRGLPTENALLDIPKSWFDGLKFERYEEEDWMVTVTVSAQQYIEEFGAPETDGTMTGDVVYKILFDGEGNVKSVCTSFDMKIGAIDAHCDIISEIVLNNVSVSAPEDASSYVLVGTEGGIVMPPIDIEPDSME